METDVNKHLTYYRFLEPVLRHSLCNTVDEQMGSTRNVSYDKWHIITVTNSAVTPLSDNTDAIQGQTCCDAGDRSVCITTWHSTKKQCSAAISSYCTAAKQILSVKRKYLTSASDTSAVPRSVRHDCLFEYIEACQMHIYHSCVAHYCTKTMFCNWAYCLLFL